MTVFVSTVQILKIDEVVKGISTKTQKPWERHTAQCMTLTDDGVIDKVGVLEIPKALQGQVQPGIYRASFALAVRDWGDRRGLIEAQLTGLLPLPPAPAPRSAAAPAPRAA